MAALCEYGDNFDHYGCYSCTPCMHVVLLGYNNYHPMQLKSRQNQISRMD